MVSFRRLAAILAVDEYSCCTVGVCHDSLGCAVACDSTDGETPEVPENQEQDAPKYELSNIRADIAQYTVVRPDGKDELTNAAVMIRTAAEAKTGDLPGITTDYVVDESKFDPNAPEAPITML